MPEVVAVDDSDDPPIDEDAAAVSSGLVDEYGKSDGLAGRVILTWPQYFDYSYGAPLTSMQMTVTDYETGKEISCVRKLVIADCDAPAIMVDLTMVCGRDGLPLLGDTMRVGLFGTDDDGRIIEKTFRYAVVSMRPLVAVTPDGCSCPVVLGGQVTHHAWCPVAKRERWHQP
jgi:hypothetical protein